MDHRNRIIRKPEAVHMAGVSASTLMRMELAGTFPKRVKLSTNSVGYLYMQVLEWVESRQPRQ